MPTNYVDGMLLAGQGSCCFMAKSGLRETSRITVNLASGCLDKRASYHPTMVGQNRQVAAKIVTPVDSAKIIR